MFNFLKFISRKLLCCIVFILFIFTIGDSFIYGQTMDQPAKWGKIVGTITEQLDLIQYIATHGGGGGGGGPGSVIATNVGTPGYVLIFSGGHPDATQTGRWVVLSGGGNMISDVYDPANGARQVAFADNLNIVSNLASESYIHATNAEMMVLVLSNDLISLYTIADATLSNNLISLYTSADNTLSNNLISLYTSADNTLSNNLISLYTSADNTLSNNLIVLYTTSDNTLSNNLIALYTSADNTLSNNLISLYTSADNTLSNNLIVLYTTSDNTLSNNLVTLYQFADTVLSNMINGKVGNTEFQNTNDAIRTSIGTRTNTIVLAGENMVITAVTNGTEVTYTLASTGGGSGGGDMYKLNYDPANGNRQVAFSNDLIAVSNLLAGKADIGSIATLSNNLVTLYTSADTVLSNMINGKVGNTEFQNSNTALRAYTDSATNQVYSEAVAYVNSNIIGSLLFYWNTNRMTTLLYTNNANVGTNIFDGQAIATNVINTNRIFTTSSGGYVAGLIATNQSYSSIPHGVASFEMWAFESDAGSMTVEPELYLVGVDSGVWYEYGESVVPQSIPTTPGKLLFTIPYPSSTVTTERVYFAIRVKTPTLVNTPNLQIVVGGGYATHLALTLPVSIITEDLMSKTVYDPANGARQVAFSNDLIAVNNVAAAKIGAVEFQLTNAIFQAASTNAFQPKISSNLFEFTATATTNISVSLGAGVNAVTASKASFYHRTTNSFPIDKSFWMYAYSKTNREVADLYMKYSNKVWGVYNINTIESGTNIINVADTTGLAVGNVVCFMGLTNEFAEVTNVTSTAFVVDKPLTLYHAPSSGVSRVQYLPINRILDFSYQNTMSGKINFTSTTSGKFVISLEF